VAPRDVISATASHYNTAAVLRVGGMCALGIEDEVLMPETAAIILVITMTIGSHEIERHELTKSLSECWERAQATMQQIRTQQREDVKITKIGIGCVIDLGNPA